MENMIRKIHLSTQKSVMIGIGLAVLASLFLFTSIRAINYGVGDDVVVINASDVYSKSKTSSTVVGSVVPGDEGIVLQLRSKPSGDWAKIDFPNFNGWMFQEDLELAVTSPPADPSNLGATADSATSISLTWDDNATDEDNYEVERCTGAGCSSFALVSTLGADSISFADSGLIAETSYTYRVRATNSAGASGYSNEASVTTPALPSPPDGDPTNLSATSTGASTASLTWDDNATNEDSYEVERCEGAGCSSFALVSTLGVDSESFDDSGLSSNTSYTYRVRAVNAAGNSAYSNESTAVTDSSTLPPIEDVVIGYIGCSMTRDKGTGVDIHTNVETWTRYAPDGVTKVLQSYSGGGITDWGEGNNIKWNAFGNGLAAWPDTNIILWEVCIKEEDIAAGVNAYLDDVQYIADEVEAQTDADLYVIGQVGYEPGVVCPTIGAGGESFSQDIADLAVANTYAQHPDGLVLGLLGAHQVSSDGCHVNSSGREEQACQIEAWLSGSDPASCQL